ncbi:hypothetical protein [Zhihengliuella flava]|uniref:Uncharacterized protein n=1 Tax=Zhihengliuella flava TaxID=1285193 RepID=A0A931D3Y0_9MICC|nr:hypothetical protein [Zhihengliuella flava]MBG6083290.1 hypothetical protein [Zhihengliuella flava]
MSDAENFTLTLADADTMADLRTFLARARSILDGDIALVARGAAIAVYVPVLQPQGLGEGTPTVLGMRAFGLGQSAELTGVFGLGALTDRLARMNPVDTALQLPPAESRAAWAGVLPPVAGWEPVGEYDGATLVAIADAGTRAVVEALPPNAGQPVLATVRSRIWAEPLADGPAPDVPQAVAFGAQALGFLPDSGSVRVLGNGTWRRFSTPAGHIVTRPGARL